MDWCLNCGGQGTRVRAPLRYPLRRCCSCGLTYAEAWHDGFDPSHDDYYRERRDHGWRPDELSLRRASGVLARLAARVPGRRMLDVGCGRGEMVEAATRQGWDALGIDLSTAAVAHCTERGLQCRQIDLFDDELERGTYDVIVMSEFLEHVPHPRCYLERVRTLLSPGGRTYLTTPNYGCLTHRIVGRQWDVIGEGHVAYYTPKTLRGVLHASGLSAEEVVTRNISLVAIRMAARARRPGPAPSNANVADAWAEGQELRHRVEASEVLRFGKKMANGVLARTGAGDTIAAIARAH